MADPLSPLTDTAPVTPPLADGGTAAPPAAAPGTAGLPADARSAPSAPPVAGPTAAPTVVKPVRRGGLAGIIDEFRDAIAGTEGPGHVYTDSEGNQYIQHPQMSHKGQWLKIAGEAIRGAAAGMAAGPGPGGKARALEAGVESGDKIRAQQQEQEQQLSQGVRQANIDRMNSIKLKHETSAAEFDLQRRQVKATDDDIQFSQQQMDRERSLGSSDLGIYKDEADLARVKEVHPEFWKDIYKNNVVAVPELNQKGERVGIHLFLRAPGVGSQLVPPGTPIKVFAPGKTPTDPPTLTDKIPTVPQTQDQVDAANNAAQKQYQQWFKDKADRESEKAKTELIGAETGKNKAEAAKDRAEAEATKAKAGGASGYLERPDGTVWIGKEAEATAAGLPFEPMKPGDINKDKQAMRQLNDVQLNTSRYTKAAQAYADPNAVLTYHGKPVSENNPVHPESALSLIGMGSKITTPQALRERDNTNLNTLMNKAGYADVNASIAAGGHITLPVLTAFTESVSRQINSRAYNELSDQAKDLYDGYLRTLSSVPAYQKALTGIGRSNKEMLDLELGNIKHPGYRPDDILRGQEAFQQNIEKAADGFPRNMVGVAHPAETRRQLEKHGGELPDDVKNMLNSMSPQGAQ